MEGMGVKSAEFAVLCLYTGAVAAYHFLYPAGRWILFGVLVLWFLVQFACHWRYTLFGASERKLKGYNECFRGTVRLIPESRTRLIPDLYHIALHFLILANIIACLAAGA